MYRLALTIALLATAALAKDVPEKAPGNTARVAIETLFSVRLMVLGSFRMVWTWTTGPETQAIPNRIALCIAVRWTISRTSMELCT